MPGYLFDLYSAFTGSAFGGSHAGIIYDGEGLDTETMQQIAREVRAPATCFVMSVKDREVSVRFFSTAQEYPMCGHGTLALMTGLISRGYLDIPQGATENVHLHTPTNSALVKVAHQNEGRVEVMLNLEPAEFEAASIDADQLRTLFGGSPDDLESSLPVEFTASDFSHLVIPLATLASVQSLAPDFDRLNDYCEKADIDTVILFCQQTVEPENTVHCREFAPRAGTPEVPAAGTTNRALACYLARHALIQAGRDALCVIRAEQGYEIQRPSLVTTRMILKGNLPTDIWVGGLATQVVRGQFSL
jgi:trans-2,3-dihydro-3-hydroxyanthranilate isomerase